MKKQLTYCVLPLLACLMAVAGSLANAEDIPRNQEPRALRISDGDRFEPKSYYPKFSWEVTPQYFMFGDGSRVLFPEEVRSIAARTSFICIEKSHGSGMLGAAELGAKHEAAAFKKLNPDAKVLFYFNSAYAYPFTSYTKGLATNKIDQHPELKQFLLVDPQTGELARRGNVYKFDVLNPEFRDWWSDTVAKGVAESGCDGAFIDQMHGFVWMRPDKQKEVERSMGEMMALLKSKMGTDKILLGNNAHTDAARPVFPVVDAIMFEHYSAKLLTKEKLLEDWRNMRRIAKAGKISIFRIGVEHELDEVEKASGKRRQSNRDERLAEIARERLEYYHACYLIGAQPYSYFQYGWGWRLSSGSLQEYPDLQKPLGAPTGRPRRIDPEGWEFTREYEHASVWVNTETQQAKITWR
ncbi:putative glycoside hydrolase [Rhodopirellula sallentina]|nr:putative glycoside hydrolase [Rhodopirellula sallentina]